MGVSSFNHRCFSLCSHNGLTSRKKVPLWCQKEVCLITYFSYWLWVKATIFETQRWWNSKCCKLIQYALFSRFIQAKLHSRPITQFIRQKKRDSELLHMIAWALAFRRNRRISFLENSCSFKNNSVLKVDSCKQISIPRWKRFNLPTSRWIFVYFNWTLRSFKWWAQRCNVGAIWLKHFGLI